MGYKILEMDNIPEALKNKSRWVTCAAFVTGVLTITASAIAVGAFIGYTYCYIEHKRAISSGNLTQPMNLQILHMPFVESEGTTSNRTINGALSNILVSRILKIGHILIDDDLISLNWPCEETQ